MLYQSIYNLHGKRLQVTWKEPYHLPLPSSIVFQNSKKYTLNLEDYDQLSLEWKNYTYLRTTT